MEVPFLVDIERRERLQKKYSFFVRNRVCKAILDLGILLATLDGRTMVCPVIQVLGIQFPLPARP